MFACVRASVCVCAREMCLGVIDSVKVRATASPSKDNDGGLEIAESG